MQLIQQAKLKPTPSSSAVTGTVIIPAHNEAATIGRTLQRLLGGGVPCPFEVIVVSNASTDGTAAVARTFPRVTVLELAEPSKAAALNAGDAAASAWPRLYLDADIEIGPETVGDLFDALADDPAVLAVRPPYRHDTAGASRLVRAYYRARGRTTPPGVPLWGAGAYAVSRAGHDRFGRFPERLGDDLHVSSCLQDREKRVVDTVPVVVRSPRTVRNLLRIVRRHQRGNREQRPESGGMARSTSAGTLIDLLRSVRTPMAALDAAVYIGVSTAGRMAARSIHARAWERDDSSRSPHSGGSPARDRRSDMVDHVVLTRFNLPSGGLESLIRAREGWLRDRIALFEHYTLPSLAAQTDRDFHWIVYVDPESPQWLMDRMRGHAAAGHLVLIERVSVSPDELLGDIAGVVGTQRDFLLTTNLDNDDGVATDFVERLKAVGAPRTRCAIYLAHGLIKSSRGLYLTRDEANAFCSVREPWPDAVTCWSDWHNLLSRSMPVVTVEGPPSWLQVVHGNNVSNRVKGRLVSAAAYGEGFGSLLSDLDPPSRAALLTDAVAGRGWRLARESARAAAKQLMMRWGGKAALESARWRLFRLLPTEQPRRAIR